MKRTKIICTLGPASSKKSVLKSMIRAGMDIARFNFSHGSHEEHRGRVDLIKNLREELNIPVAMLLDTKGPEIRTKLLKDHKKVTLEAGSEFTLTTGDIEGDETRVAITYENLYKDVKKGGKILIDDGLIELEIENIKNGDIVCRVLNRTRMISCLELHRNLTILQLLLSGMQRRSKRSASFWMKTAVRILALSPRSRMQRVLKILTRSSGQQMALWWPEVILV